MGGLLASGRRGGARRGTGTGARCRRAAMQRLRLLAMQALVASPTITTPTLDLIKATPKGGLHNPYKDKIAEIADAGHKKYMSAGCNGCHGGGGGGGMCPPLTNDTWVYGPDDDTLFRLIALGSDGLKAAGYHRVKQEVVVGPMPPFGGIIKTSDDLWKIITWIRSVNPSSATKPPLQ